MCNFIRLLSVAIAIGLLFAPRDVAAENAKSHRVAIQVDQNDSDVMNLALNNAQNVVEYFNARGEDIDVEIVTYGPGLHTAG